MISFKRKRKKVIKKLSRMNKMEIGVITPNGYDPATTFESRGITDFAFTKFDNSFASDVKKGDVFLLVSDKLPMDGITHLKIGGTLYSIEDRKGIRGDDVDVYHKIQARLA